MTHDCSLFEMGKEVRRDNQALVKMIKPVNPIPGSPYGKY
jgi:hypothetical protein